MKLHHETQTCHSGMVETLESLKTKYYLNNIKIFIINNPNENREKSINSEGNQDIFIQNRDALQNKANLRYLKEKVLEDLSVTIKTTKATVHKSNSKKFLQKHQ